MYEQEECTDPDNTPHINAINNQSQQRQRKNQIPTPKYNYCRSNRLCYHCESKEHSIRFCPKRMNGEPAVLRNHYPVNGSNNNSNGSNQKNLN